MLEHIVGPSTCVKRFGDFLVGVRVLVVYMVNGASKRPFVVHQGVSFLLPRRLPWRRRASECKLGVMW